MLVNELLLYLCNLITLLLIFLTITRYKIWMVFLVSKKMKSQKESIFTRGEGISSLLFEILIIIPHPTTFFFDKKINFKSRDTTDIFYKYNEICNLLQLLRIYIVIRYLLLKSEYMSNRARRICKMYDFQPSYKLTIKCVFKNNPYKTLFIFITGGIFIFAQACRISGGFF